MGFASYEIARSGLFVNERGLYVTGHNIANVNTTGYVRQQAMIKNGPVQNNVTKNGLVQYGLGADIQEIRQIRHTFLDNIYRQENTTLGYWDTRQKTFRDVEAIMAEPMESGLQNVLNQFWDSWQELSKEPDSLTVRALVRQRSEALVQMVNQMGTQLDQLQRDLNSELVVRIDEMNTITSDIAALNLKIVTTEVSGDSANDYRDQLNLLLDRLTKLANVSITEMQDGQVDVTLSGYFLVQKGNSTDLYASEKNPGEGFYVVKLEGTDIQVSVKSGIIKGLLEARGEVSGAIGSYGNGTPNTLADVVFFVDTSTMADADEVNARVDAYRNELQKRGIDANVIIEPVSGDMADTIENFDAASLRSAAGKYAILITDNVPGDFTPLQEALTAQGMEASVITDDAAAWADLAGAYDGTVYRLADFAATDAAIYTMLAKAIAADTNSDVGESISVVGETTNIVSDMKQRLNAMINVMLREINYIHKSGYNMKDPPTAGEDLFVTIHSGRPLEMGNIQINPNLSDLSNIAASRNGDSGDNTNALEIANLRNKSLILDKTGLLSLDDYYQSIILQLGNRGSDAVRITESQTKLVLSAEASRTSIAGVSMDEEMTNMMKFKFAYNAASRALSVIDSMMDTIVNKMGLAGR